MRFGWKWGTWCNFCLQNPSTGWKTIHKIVLNLWYVEFTLALVIEWCIIQIVSKSNVAKNWAKIFESRRRNYEEIKFWRVAGFQLASVDFVNQMSYHWVMVMVVAGKTTGRHLLGKISMKVKKPLRNWFMKDQTLEQIQLLEG